MSVYRFASIAVNAVMPALGEPSLFTQKGTGISIGIRAIPDSESDEMPGMEGRTVFQDRRNFLVAEKDFGAIVPASGDTLTVRGVRWRIADAEQIHPAAPMWKLHCTPTRSET